MYKTICLFVLILLFSYPVFCQTKATVDREIALIRQVPQSTGYKDRVSKADRHYKAILKLDTMAVPFLIDRITDTTQSEVLFRGTDRKFKTGDIAYALLKQIEVMIPPYWVFGIQNDVLLPNYPIRPLDYVDMNNILSDRKRSRDQLRFFYQSRRGKLWVRIIKEKMTKAEREKLMQEL